jgi:signal transduction histidine kinase
MGARIVMPLRILLPCLAVGLVASAAVVIGVTGASTASGYLMRQADDALRGCAASVLSQGLVAMPGPDPAAGRVVPGACGIELRSAGGQILIPAAPAAPGPAIPASGSWPPVRPARPVTVPGPGGRRWRAVVTAVRYQPQRMPYVYGPDDLRYAISGPAGPGSSGQLVALTPLAGTGRAAAGFAAAAGAVLVLLAVAAFALTRAILRPLREAAGLAGDAGQDATGRLEEVMARLGRLADRDDGWRGPALASLRERLQASRAAEAAALRSAADMSGELGQACVQLRRPASIVHGFAEYCGSQDRPPPAGLNQMMERLTGEITRMETLAGRLRMYHQPDP